MPPKDARLKQLETRLRGLVSRKKQLEKLVDGEFRRKSIRLIEQNISATEREIRKRAYVLSGKK